MDGQILLWIQEYVRVEVLNDAVLWFTSLNNHGYIAIAACLLMLALPRLRKVGATAALSLLMNVLIVNVTLKPMVARIRPYEVVQGLRLLGEAQTDFSFPSGHSGAAFAVAVVMYKLLPKKYGVPALVFAALIALSRLYIGVHYPTDVLVGTVIGSLTAVIACLLLRRWNAKKA